MYKSPEKGSVDISRLINEIRKIKKLEKNTAANDTMKLAIYNKKSRKIGKILNV